MHSNNEGYWVDFSAPVDVMKAVKEYAKANPALEILSDARCENEVDSTC
jgi:hypothetical protein